MYLMLMSGRSKNGNELIKTVKFIINTDKRQESVLNKLTAKRTNAIIKYLQLFKEQEVNSLERGIETKIIQATITTANRLEVENDFRTLTGLNYSDLVSCCRTALALWNSYQVLTKEWEERAEKVSSSILTSMLSNLDFDLEGNIIKFNQNLENVTVYFSETTYWKRFQKNKPSEPLTHYKFLPKKIPTFLKTQGGILAYQTNKKVSFYQVRNDKLYIKLSTLKSRQVEELELPYNSYYEKMLSQGRFTGGKIIKNIKNNRWEFHANIRIERPKPTKNNKQVVIGIDMGQIIDATVVALVRGEKLKQSNIYLLKEGDLRRKKFNLTQRIKVLQRMKDTFIGLDRKQAINELKQLHNKRKIVSIEACHRISKKVSSIAKAFNEQGFEVHVAIGKLKGLRFKARKGNGRGKKYRGRTNSFSYDRLTNFITYKCLEVGVANVKKIRESWTSRTCHKCDSLDTLRSTQASFKCLNCGLQYHADVNSAVNIAKRYWSQTACSSCNSLHTSFRKKGNVYCNNCKANVPYQKNAENNLAVVTMIFLLRKSEGMSKSNDLCSLPHGIHDFPACNELTGINIQSKVEEARK